MRSIAWLSRWNRRSHTIERIADLASKLRCVTYAPPMDEQAVQNSFESLLVGASVPYRRELDSVTYASKRYIPDFTMPDLELAVEIKMCNRVGREKHLLAEINDDVLAYRRGFHNLLFVVYDVGMIRDVGRFTAEFGPEGVLVLVVKH